MGEHNSPFFALGVQDGQRDTLLVSACPPADPEGMDPARAWSWMYKRGYERAFQPDRHVCTDVCKAAK